jgi:hypothetical protein
VRLGLVDAAHHHSNAAQGGLHRIGVINVDPAAAHAVPKLAREMRGLLGVPARHDDPIRVVEREIRRHAVSHGAVAAGDQDIGAIRHRPYLLWWRGVDSRGLTALLDQVKDPDNQPDEKDYDRHPEQQREQQAQEAATHHRAHAAHHAASTEGRNEQQDDDRPDQDPEEYFQAVVHGLYSTSLFRVRTEYSTQSF